ncbi:DUF547 domain-containing protein [Robiginitalea sp. SC105]|uniref:DUF547 domain-containing protein n=1 Tax=Robiginitalea sp. SC105 TaxID=2762332 RepID=UPI0016396130|nr:DUF547 domain-containing protein [Robiginitalea sp. SC105]MBC2837821.1 DUF547 domain-containing protein [Robiginitalea sp. SC105]
MAVLKLFLFLLFVVPLAAPCSSQATPGLASGPSHEIWDGLVRKNVYPDGTVNYNGFARDREKLDRYISGLEQTPPAEGWSRETRLAYWINLYNAATVRLILDHFPLESIMGIRNPWGQNILSVGGEPVNLNQIEHDVLRPMGDPRIHFAINCASASCPVLQPFAFNAEKLDEQLDQAARGFIKDPARNKTTRGAVELSRIFKWYKKDFTDESGTLIAYINQYLENPLPEGTDVGFLTYDWSLNRP